MFVGSVSSSTVAAVILLILIVVAGSMRRSSPVIVISLIILIVGLGFSTVGNSKRNAKTIVGAMLYVIGGKVH